MLNNKYEVAKAITKERVEKNISTLLAELYFDEHGSEKNKVNYLDKVSKTQWLKKFKNQHYPRMHGIKKKFNQRGNFIKSTTFEDLGFDLPFEKFKIVCGENGWETQYSQDDHQISWILRNDIEGRFIVFSDDLYDILCPTDISKKAEIHYWDRTYVHMGV